MPPDVPSVQVAVRPVQKEVLVADIGSGTALTVKDVVTVELPVTYNIFVVPAASAVAKPDELMVATVVLVLYHVPEPKIPELSEK